MTDVNTLYATHDNPLVLNFTFNDSAQSLLNATRISVTLVEPNLTYDSVSQASMFDLTQAATGIIKMNFSQITLADGTYTLRVVVYDSVNTHGIVYAHEKDDYPVILKFTN